jgi:hypothetical protein
MPDTIEITKNPLVEDHSSHTWSHLANEAYDTMKAHKTELIATAAVVGGLVIVGVGARTLSKLADDAIQGAIANPLGGLKVPPI